jgi:5-methylcytosine-specific restriction endonuclease McrA
MKRVGHLGITRLTGDDMYDLRLSVFTRDRFECARCGTKVTWDNGELAHIESRGRGGSDVESNVETSCKKCHRDEHQPKVVRSK